MPSIVHSMNTRVGSPGLEEKKATQSQERRGVGLIRAALANSCCVHCFLSMRVRILREGIGSRLERVVHGLVRRGVFEILHLQSRRDTHAHKRADADRARTPNAWVSAHEWGCRGIRLHIRIAACRMRRLLSERTGSAPGLRFPGSPYFLDSTGLPPKPGSAIVRHMAPRIR
jgi:hypothetical protein